MTMTMCTTEEVQKIVQSELETVLSSFVTKFWYIIGGMIFSSLAAWFGLYYQVQAIEKEAISQEVGVQRQIEILRQDYIRDMHEIKTDLRFIRDRI